MAEDRGASQPAAGWRGLCCEGFCPHRCGLGRPALRGRRRSSPAIINHLHQKHRPIFAVDAAFDSVKCLSGPEPPKGCYALAPLAPEPLMVPDSKLTREDTTVFYPFLGHRSQWFAYAVGFLAVAIGTLLRYALDPLLADHGVFATYFPAVAVAVFFGRLSAGLWSIFLSTLAADFLFFSPRHSLGIQGSTQAAELLAFMLGAGIIVGFGEAMHIARNKAAELRKKSEANEKKARQIVETANEGIWVLDANARISMVNPRMCEMLGYPVEEMLGAHKWDFFFPEDTRAMQQLFERRRAGISEHVDVRFRTREGKELWTLMAARSLRDPDGHFEGALDMFTDITQRKYAEDRLEQAVTERGDRVREIAREMELFSYSMAHDLRAPLRAMQGLARVVLEDFSSFLPQEGRDHLHRLAAAAAGS